MTCLSSSKIRRYLPTYLLLVHSTYKNAESRQVVPVGTYFSFGLFLQEHCFELFLLVHSVVVVPEIYFLWLIIPFKTIWFFGREQKMIGSLLKKQRSDKSTKEGIQTIYLVRSSSSLYKCTMSSNAEKSPFGQDNALVASKTKIIFF